MRRLAFVDHAERKLVLDVVCPHEKPTVVHSLRTNQRIRLVSRDCAVQPRWRLRRRTGRGGGAAGTAAVCAAAA